MTSFDRQSPPNQLTGGELLEVFLALVPDAAVVVDDKGAIVSANEQAQSLFGYSIDQLRQLPVETLVPERFRHQHRSDRTGYGKAPQPRPMGAGLELSGRRRDGTEFPVDISLAPLSGSEKPLIIATVRDATDRRAATAAQAQLAAIVQSSLDAMVSMTVEGKITSWNPGAEGIFGYSADEMVGRHISALVPVDMSIQFEEVIGAVLAGQPTAPLDTQWLRKDGARLDVALSISPLHDAGGRPLGLSALLRDITGRKQDEAELRRLLAEERRQERWQAATAEIRLSLLSGSAVHESLTIICRWATELLEADLAEILVTDGPELRLAAAHGPETGRRERPSDAELGFAELVMAGGGVEQGTTALGGPVLGVPILSDRGLQGVLLLTEPPEHAPFGSEASALAEGLAEQAALALELNHARQAHERLLLVGERERIARDLHDLVIQRLFATGIGLQSVLRLLDNQRAVDRVSQAVEELDTTIREIRSTIFALETPLTAASGLRAEILKLAARASEGLGFEPSVRFDGPVDAGVPDAVVPQLLAVVREALANVARHAHARHVEVDLTVSGGRALLVVADDGVGLGEARRESGLVNLRERSRELGGTLRIDSPPGGGTRLEWQVPLSG